MANPNIGKERNKLPKEQRPNLWKPGQSGNPKGRKPNKECLTPLMRKEIEKIAAQEKQLPDGKRRTWKELIVLATIRLAIEGNATALKEVWERIDGKVKQEIEAQGDVALKVYYVNRDRNPDNTADSP